MTARRTREGHRPQPEPFAVPTEPQHNKKKSSGATRSEAEAAVALPQPQASPQQHEQCSAISNQNIPEAAHTKSRGKIIESIALRKGLLLQPHSCANNPPAGLRIQKLGESKRN